MQKDEDLTSNANNDGINDKGPTIINNNSTQHVRIDPWENININLSKVLEDDTSITSSNAVSATATATDSIVVIRSPQNRHEQLALLDTKCDSINRYTIHPSLPNTATTTTDDFSKDMLGNITANLSRYMLSDHQNEVSCSPPPGLSPISSTASTSLVTKALTTSSTDTQLVRHQRVNGNFTGQQFYNASQQRHKNHYDNGSQMLNKDVQHNRHSIASISELTNHLSELNLTNLRNDKYRKSTPLTQINHLMHLLSGRLCILEESSASIDKKLDMYEYHCRKKLEDCRDQMKKRIDELVEEYGKQIGVTIKNRRKSLQVLERNVEDHLTSTQDILTQAKLKLSRTKVSKEDIFAINDVLFDCLVRTKKFQRDSSEFNYWLDFIPCDPLENDTCIGILQYSEQDEPSEHTQISDDITGALQSCYQNNQLVVNCCAGLQWDVNNAGVVRGKHVPDILPLCTQSSTVHNQSTINYPTALNCQKSPFSSNLIANPRDKGFNTDNLDVSPNVISNFNNVPDKNFIYRRSIAESNNPSTFPIQSNENCLAPSPMVEQKAMLANRRNSWHPMMHTNSSFYSSSKSTDLVNQQFATNNAVQTNIDCPPLLNDIYQGINNWNKCLPANNNVGQLANQHPMLTTIPLKNYVHLLPNNQHPYSLNNNCSMMPQSFDDCNAAAGSVAFRKQRASNSSQFNRMSMAGSVASSLLTLDMQRPIVVDCYGEPLRHLKCIKGLSFMSFNRLLICENGRRSGSKNVLMFSLTGSFLNYLNPPGCPFTNPTGICVMQYSNSSDCDKNNIRDMIASSGSIQCDYTNCNDTNEQSIVVVDGLDLKLISSNTGQMISSFSLDNKNVDVISSAVSDSGNISSDIVQEYKQDDNAKKTVNSAPDTPISGTVTSTFQRQDRYGGLHAIDNVVYICDRKAPSVKVFDIRTSKIVAEWTSPDIINPNFAFRKNNHVYVSDSSSNKVIKLNMSDGKKICELISSNNNRNIFNNPSGLCDDGDNMAVADLYNNRIQLFSKDCLIGSIYSPCIESPFSISYHPMGVMAISNGRPRTVTLYFTMLS